MVKAFITHSGTLSQYYGGVNAVGTFKTTKQESAASTATTRSTRFLASSFIHLLHILLIITDCSTDEKLRANNRSNMIDHAVVSTGIACIILRTWNWGHQAKSAPKRYERKRKYRTVSRGAWKQNVMHRPLFIT